MGGLGAPFILCPLSERKELLGMSGDEGGCGRVILTTGKNMAIRYHVLEQKQETSWTSSRHWFTSRVVKCCQINKYGAVLDNNTVALWDEEDTALESITKLKFSDPIWELHPGPKGEEDSLIVFENGYVTCLSTVTDMKKKVRKSVASGKGFLDNENDVIIDCAHCENDLIVIISAPKKVGRNIVRRDQMKASLLRNNELLMGVDVKCDFVGHCILPGPVPSLLYMAADGRLWQHHLDPESTSPSNPTLLGSLGKFVGIKTPVVMRAAPPSEDGEFSKIVIYGSDPSEEGALIILYDLKYDIVVAKQGLKMYGTPPIMDTVGSNVLIPVGLHVLVLALYASKSLLSCVIGKHGIRTGEEVFEQRSPFIPGKSGSEWEVDDAEPGTHGHKKKTTTKMTRKQKSRSDAEVARELEQMKKMFPSFWEVIQQYKILEREGQPQALICTQILPLSMEKGEPALHWMLQTFTDIPESLLVCILSTLLQPLGESSLSNLHPLLSLILNRAVDSRELGMALSSLEFPLVRKLSLYLKSRMEAALNGQDLREDIGMECSVLWLTSLLDSHYTHFVLGEETFLVDELLNVVEPGAAWLEAIGELEPYLILTRQKVDFRPRPSPHSRWRTEILTFV